MAKNNKNLFDLSPSDIAWCPGCGNFPLRSALMAALSEIQLNPYQLVLVSGIGQAAKAPQYLRCHYFNGLHGRSLPVATAIKMANPELTVIVESGDGCIYGEGGNHFLHAIRRNPDITVIIHNNMVYGLTKGQASPTSGLGFRTPVQVWGSPVEPFNPIATAVALNASFVARAFSGDFEQSKQIIKQAVKHRGIAIVDIFQPCVSFNKVNTFQWFKENTYYLQNHDPRDRYQAFRKALEENPFPLGVFYQTSRPTIEEQQPVYRHEATALFRRRPSLDKLARFIATTKV
ncbi:MAG: thiamine pyrophosphate-dependent enzyme [Candidatus Aminicenantales bacterium]